MAFNGSGTFNRLYRWVTDAANGLFINATKFDAEMDGMATGLSNCMTRDGQSPPTADIPMGGHKLTGLATGTAAGDAANVGQLAAAVSEWVTETATVTYLSATSFMVAGGSDLTQRYYPGTRILWVATGPTFVTATVVSASFSTPNTTVTVVCDFSSLSSSLVSLSHGLISYLYPSYLSPRSAVFATAAATVTAASATSGLIPFDTEALDSLGEFDTATHRFTAKYPGVYHFRGSVSLQPNTNITNPGGGVTTLTNGVTNSPSLFYGNFPGTYSPGLFVSMPFNYLVSLNNADYVEVYAALSGAAWTSSALGCNLSVDRIV